MKEQINILNNKIDVISNNKDGVIMKNKWNKKQDLSTTTITDDSSSAATVMPTSKLSDVATTSRSPRKLVGNKNITTKQLSNAINEVKAIQKCTEYIHMNEHDTDNTKSIHHKVDEWRNVKSKKRQRTVVVGNNEEITINGREIKSVPKYSDLHVYRLDPSMTADELTALMKPFLPEAQCQVLSSKYPGRYSSFKVTIYSKNWEIAMDSAKWPMGAYIQPFFQPRKKQGN